MKTYSFELNGEVIQLRPDFEAMDCIEKSCERSIFDLSLEITNGRPSLSNLINVIFAGQQSAGGRFTSRQKLYEFLKQDRFYAKPAVSMAILNFLGELLAAGGDSGDSKKNVMEQPTPNTASKSQPETST